MFRQFIIVMLFLLPYSPSIASEPSSKELVAERHQAQKQRQAEKLKRHRENTKAFTVLRHSARELDQQYAHKTHALDTQFRLKKVGLKADREIKIAEAQASLQKTLSTVYMDPAKSGSPAAVKKIQTVMTQHADRLFEIKKQAAELEYEAQLDNVEKKHKLLDKKDDEILHKAQELGLRAKPEPILATPIGGKLTDAERRWN